MLPYQLDRLDEQKLQQLCSDATSESQTLEFKRELPGKSDKIEFLKDVSAMANADGGDLVYGIEEKSGAALRPNPISVTSADAEMRRLGQILNGGIEPRITGVRFQGVPVNGGYILVVRIPQSYDGPHRIAQDDDGRFVLRTGTHTSDMSYSQLRNAFDRTATLVERAKGFRSDRLDAIAREATPIPILEGPICVAHIIPLASLTGRHSIDVVALSRNSSLIYPHDWGSGTRTLNIDGVVAHSVMATNGGRFGYNQIYRTGCTESVFHGGSSSGDRMIPSTTITNLFRKTIKMNITFLKQSGLSGPAIVGVAMLNVQDYTFAVNSKHIHMGRAVADRSSLVVPEVWVESLDGLVDIDGIVKPLMDILWQSFGLEKCFEMGDDVCAAPNHGAVGA